MIAGRFPPQGHSGFGRKRFFIDGDCGLKFFQGLFGLLFLEERLAQHFQGRSVIGAEFQQGFQVFAGRFPILTLNGKLRQLAQRCFFHRRFAFCVALEIGQQLARLGEQQFGFDITLFL